MTADKIVKTEKAIAIAECWRQTGEEVVFTNGCFDILHLGHVDYLEKAAQKGTKLIIGVNTDKSIAKIKGKDRPIIQQESRARLLAALAFVDLVVFFEEDTPLKLINALLPDVLIKGSDYLAENIVGADIVLEHGGKVETIDLVKGYSTTLIIEKINKLKK